MGQDIHVKTRALLHRPRVGAVTFHPKWKRPWQMNTVSHNSHGSSQAGYFELEIVHLSFLWSPALSSATGTWHLLGWITASLLGPFTGRMAPEVLRGCVLQGRHRWVWDSVSLICFLPSWFISELMTLWTWWCMMLCQGPKKWTLTN